MTNSARPKLTFEQQQHARELKSEWAADSSKRGLEAFGRMVRWSVGLPYFWDLKPGERKMFYAEFPPIATDGSVALPFPERSAWLADPVLSAMPYPFEGFPDWGAIERDSPAEFDRYVEDYGKLLQDEMERAGLA